MAGPWESKSHCIIRLQCQVNDLLLVFGWARVACGLVCLWYQEQADLWMQGFGLVFVDTDACMFMSPPGVTTIAWKSMSGRLCSE